MECNYYFKKGIFKLFFSFFIFFTFFLFPFSTSAIVISPDQEERINFKDVSQTGVIVHSQGEQDLYLRINDRVESEELEELVWIIPTPKEPKNETFYIHYNFIENYVEEKIENNPEKWEIFNFYNHKVFSPDESIHSWLQEHNYSLDRETRSLIREYKDKEWHLTAIRMLSDPLKEVVKEFDQEVQTKVTKDNLDQELGEKMYQALSNNDFEKFQHLSNYLTNLNYPLYKSLGDVTEEEFRKQASEVLEHSSEKSEEVRRSFMGSIKQNVDRLKLLYNRNHPQEFLREISQDLENDIQENVTEDNLIEKLMEVFLRAVKNGDDDKLKLVFKYFMDLSFDERSRKSYRNMYHMKDERKEIILAYDDCTEKEKEYLFALFRGGIQEEFDKWQEWKKKEPKRKFIPSFKVSFKSENPVYPLKAFRSLGEDGVKTSLYVLSDDPVLEPDQWKVNIKDARNSEGNSHGSIFFRDGKIFNSGSYFVLGIERSLEQEDMDKNIFFEFSSSIPEDYIEKPSLELKRFYYEHGESKINVGGEILDMGGANVVETWFEWGKTKDLDRRAGKGLHYSAEEVRTDIKGLESDSYYYRFAVANSAGVTYSDISHFTVRPEKKKIQVDKLPGPSDVTPEASKVRQRLKGEIILRVKANGEAYYINPKDLSVYSLGRPEDAFQVMRKQGVGISNQDLSRIQPAVSDLSSQDTDNDGIPDDLEKAIGTSPDNPDTDGDGYTDQEEIKNGYNFQGAGKLKLDSEFARKQQGKILLQVEDQGQAWYVNPGDNKKYFLGRPVDAFRVMRHLGQGISEDDFSNLNQIKKGVQSKEGGIDREKWNEKDLFGGDKDIKIINTSPFEGTEADEILIGELDKANILDASAGGNNILWARGKGKEDTMIGGPGNDKFVVMGDLSSYGKTDFSEIEIIDVLGVPVPYLSGYDFNEDADGGEETIKGGGGTDILYTVGDADISNFNISGVEVFKIR